MSLIKKELDKIWNTGGVRYPCHFTKWNWALTPPTSFDVNRHLKATKGKWTFPRTTGQLVRQGLYLHKRGYFKWR